MLRPSRPTLAVLGLCCLLAGCGARLSEEQKQRVFASGNNGAIGGDGVVTGPGANPSAGPGVGPGATTGPGSGPGVVPGATTGPGTGPGATAGPGATTGPGAPPPCTPTDSKERGVTKDSVTVANIADISGPVPGLFKSAQDATKAFAAYYNATFGGVCGRQLKVKTYDSGTTSSGSRARTLEACDQTFASVGSISAFDDGGAPVEDRCGLPDISAAAVTRAHQASKVTYAAASTKAGQLSSTVPRWIAEKFPEAVKNAGYLYINAGASAENAPANIKAYEKYGHGWKFTYVKAVDIAASNYAPYVQEMKDKKIRFVQFLGAYQQAAKLAKAMKEQSFKPDIYLLDPTAYNREFAADGDHVNGTYVYLDSALFEEARTNAEMQLYLTWLRRVAGNAQPTYFGLHAWSAARLFVTIATKLGPNLTRKGMLAELPKVQKWNSNGLVSPQNVGAKQTSNCFGFIQLKGTAWTRAYPSRDWACGPLVSG